jgi:hypothetical protein
MLILLHGLLIYEKKKLFEEKKLKNMRLKMRSANHLKTYWLILNITSDRK